MLYESCRGGLKSVIAFISSFENDTSVDVCTAASDSIAIALQNENAPDVPGNKKNVETASRYVSVSSISP